jgi:uncharacterized protein
MRSHQVPSSGLFLSSRSTLLDGKNPNKKESENLSETHRNEKELASTLRLLNEQLITSQNQDQSIEIYLSMIKTYKQNLQNFSFVKLAEKWVEIEILCDKILNYSKTHIEAGLTKAESLYHTSHYKATIDFFKKNKHLSSHPKALWLTGRAFIKRNKYKDALKNLKRAQETDPNSDYTKDIELCEKLLITTHREKIQEQREKIMIPQVDDCNSKKRDETQDYTIFSFNGGGMKGIMTSFWVAELEKRTHKRFSDLANFAAGTSTGAILAVGLGYTRNGKTPLLSGLDGINLFLNQSAEIFSKNCSNYFCGPKYCSHGRKNSLSRYIDGKITDLLYPILVPAVCTSNLNTTYEFNTYDALQDPSKDYDVVDVLMASSAAPVYFPPHRIGDQIFIDGGLHANNPALLAYNHVEMRLKIPSEKISVFSFGTGDQISNKLTPTPSSGILYWAAHMLNILLPSQKGNVDFLMSEKLGKRYTVIEAWMEEQIDMDSCKEKDLTKLLDIAYQVIEEMDYSEENTFNKIVEFFDDNLNKSKNI